MSNISIPKKDAESIQSGLGKYQKILAIAKARDLNESDTVTIIADMLSDIFGYDKYIDVTSEFMIRGTFCDLAIKVNNKIEYLIECKSIGTDLKDNHLKQAIDYGANQGIKWVILTNGAIWQLHKIRFEQPINHDLVLQFDITALQPRAEETRELLYILHKNALEKNLREEHYAKTQLINPYTVTQVILSEPIVNALKREIRRLSDIKLDDKEILTLLESSIVKRDLLESDSAKDAEKSVKKLQKVAEKKVIKKKNATIEAIVETKEPVIPETSSDAPKSE